MDSQLQDVFQPMSFEHWLNLVKSSVKKEELVQALQFQDEDDITINAIYLPEEQARTTFKKPLKIPKLRQWIWLNNNLDFSEITKSTQENETNSIEFFGDFPSDNDIFLQTLSTINPAETPLYFDLGESNTSLCFILFDDLSRHLISPESCLGGINFDPLAALAFIGKYTYSPSEMYKTIEAIFSEGGKLLPRFKLIGINATSFADAGASPALELALALSLFDAYRIILSDYPLEEIPKKVQIRLSAHSEFLVNISKFKAWHILWHNYKEVFHNTFSADPEVVAVITWNSYTAFDVHNNLIRQTLQVLSSALGGCDTWLIPSYEIPRNIPTGKSLRLSRNVALLLQHETDLKEAVALAEDAPFFENYGSRLAEKAWEYFLEFQKKGGYETCIQKGIIQRLVWENIEKKVKKINLEQKVVVGGNKYYNTNENLRNLPPLPFRFQKAQGNTNLPTIKELQLLRTLEELRIKHLGK